jgi:hypothetical protein
MPVRIPLSDEELTRVVRMNNEALNLLTDYAAVRYGKTDAEMEPWRVERRKDVKDRLDMGLALELADRLGEDTLRATVDESTPPEVRATLDALITREGGVLPLLKNRIGEMNSETHHSDAFACGLGAFAIVAGVALDTILGGITAVAGIVVMAAEC